MKETTVTSSTPQPPESLHPEQRSAPERPCRSRLRRFFRSAQTALAAAAVLVLSGTTIAAPQDAGPIQIWGSTGWSTVSLPSATKIAAGGAHTVVTVNSDTTKAIAWGSNLDGQCNTPANFVPIDMAAGASHTILLRNNFTLACFGSNAFGQCTIPANIGIIDKVAAGDFHTIAIQSNGGPVICWGWNAHGQCNVPANLGAVIDADGGYSHTAVVRADGTVVCWGGNNFGQCNVPANLSSVVQVAAGFDHTVALRSDGSVVCWGNNDHGQCTVPANLGPVSQIDAGDGFTVALRTDGTVVCWGDNADGQCTVPTNLLAVSEIAAGPRFAVAITTGGLVAGWGDADLGQIATPAVLQASPIVEVDMGNEHTMIRRQNGAVFCMGANFFGQCNVPANVGSGQGSGQGAGTSPPIQIAAGSAHSAVRRADGTVVLWGGNANGQSTVPPGLGACIDIAPGSAHTAALKSDGSVVCWGSNVFGQCNVPPDLGQVVDLDARGSHTIALKADGTVVCWGLNSSGQCNVPPNLTNVVQVAAGTSHSVALRADGTVVCWGNNQYGQCNVPANLGTVIEIAAGLGHTLARRSNLTLVQWGSNEFGQTSPQLNLQVANSTGPIAAGGYGSAALKLESAPLNDECANALVVYQGRTLFTTPRATNSPLALPSSCNEGNGVGLVKDVWFSFTADASGTATISTCGEAFYDTRVAAYAGPCGALTLIACDDDSAGCGGGTSTMSFSVEDGESYLIRVGGRTGSGAGFLSIALEEFIPPENFVPVDFSASFNWSTALQTGGELYPTGNILLGGVLFSIPNSTGLNAWHAKDVPGKNPRVLEVPVDVANVVSVHALINSWWGVPGPGSLATVEFYGCNGAFYAKPLIGNVDIRDHFNGGFTNLINGTTTVEVFGNGQVRMDKVRFDLPAAFLNEKLELVRIVDTGAESVQRVWLAGLTVETGVATCAADLSGDGIVGGEDLAILLGGWGPGCVGDLDGDGIVSGADLAVMLGAWGACKP
jgi:alpha-tubulin suppressor-like RCC1 family protein